MDGISQDILGIPRFNLEETRSVLSLDNCLSNMEELVHSAQHVKMWFSETCMIHQSNRTDQEPRDNPNPLLGNADVSM